MLVVLPHIAYYTRMQGKMHHVPSKLVDPSQAGKLQSRTLLYDEEVNFKKGVAD